VFDGTSAVYQLCKRQQMPQRQQQSREGINPRNDPFPLPEITLENSLQLVAHAIPS